jgi:hypothetical protein
MNARKFGTALIVIIFLALGTVWRLGQPPAPTAAHSAATEIKLPIHPSPAPLIASTAIVAPIAPPAAKPAIHTTATKPAATATKPALPPALKEELHAMLTDLAALYQAGDMLTILRTYTSPEELAEMSPDTEKTLQLVANNPDTLQIYHALGEAFALLKNQTPEMNVAGDEATYLLAIPPGSLPPGMTDEPPRPVTFQKINGKWYLKRESDG